MIIFPLVYLSQLQFLAIKTTNKRCLNVLLAAFRLSHCHIFTQVKLNKNCKYSVTWISVQLTLLAQVEAA